LLATSPSFLLAAVPAVLIAAVSKGGLGGGLGILSVPLMALVIPPAQAAAIMLPLLCLMDLIGLRAYRRAWERRVLQAMLPGALVGILLGSLAFGYLDADVVRLLLGVIATLFAGNYFIGRHAARPARAHRPLQGGFWGMIAGFTSTLAHAGGPPVNVYLLPLRLDKTVFVATTVVFFAVINLAKLPPYAVLGLFGREVMLAVLVLAPVSAAGMLLGIWLHARISERLVYNACYLLTLLTGLKLLHDALRGLWPAG
jgi:uncharacterized membrane protein YfcA